jgi:hypothetical protein
MGWLSIPRSATDDDENRRRNLDLSPAFLGFEREVIFATVTGIDEKELGQKANALKRVTRSYSPRVPYIPRTVSLTNSVHLAAQVN